MIDSILLFLDDALIVNGGPTAIHLLRKLLGSLREVVVYPSHLAATRTDAALRSLAAVRIHHLQGGTVGHVWVSVKR